MDISDFKNTVVKRLKFIESRLYWEDSVSRGDIVSFFNISKPQATNDLVVYKKLARDNVEYNNSSKRFEKTDKFKPVFSKQTSTGYLERLLFSRRRREDGQFFCGMLPSYAQVPIFSRIVNEEILKMVLKAIREEMAIEIEYQSKERPEPMWRWITPHSFGYDGFRWHIRALCHKNKDYRDFVLPRIILANNMKRHTVDHSYDYTWHKELELIISANHKLEDGKRRATEIEYGMQNGELRRKTKAVFYFYIKRQYQFLRDSSQNKLNELVLKNKKELELQIDLLESMSKEKIEQLFCFDPEN